MERRKLNAWADRVADECRMLTTDEIKVILRREGERLLMAAVYEPIGDSGSVYKRSRA